MAYVALARKWRPRSFAELTGQEHVRKALTHALDSDRVHHAFLFTGTRGVGKTTIARILARCLNCERGVSANPCGECASCREIDEGRFVDLIEVDAASRTKVDDTRELLDNVQYAPTRGRCKVYLIDEVHMLSTHSFNALLKTLEEPPPRVKFLLATTDPQKLPPTVLSRCLQFNLKRLPVVLIAERMKFILEQEGVQYEPGGLKLLAQAADGSMRDGLSLLDQVIAFGGGRVDEVQVRDMLGTVARDHMVQLAQLFIQPDAANVVRWAAELEQWAPDHAQLLEEFASLLVRVALAQVVPDYEGDEIYDGVLLRRLAAELAPEDVQLYYQCAILGRRDLHLAPEPRAGFEMTLLRMIAFRLGKDAAAPGGAAPPAGTSGGARVSGAAAARVAAGGVRVEPAMPTAQAAVSLALPATQVERPRLAMPQTAGLLGVTVPIAPAPMPDVSDVDWGALIDGLSLTGAAAQLARNSSLQGLREGVIRLGLDPRFAARTPSAESRLAEALCAHFGQPVKLEFSIAAGVETPAQVAERAGQEALVAARQAFSDDPTVRALQERFGATLLPDTIRPNRPNH